MHFSLEKNSLGYSSLNYVNVSNNPLVSIIIAVYNAERYLKECIHSAINQSWPIKEIIIIDDGSTDNSLKIAKEFESYQCIIVGQKNKGASAARNLGLSYAKGEYIQFLDADDILDPHKIELQILQLINNENKLAVCSTVHFEDGSDYLNHFPSAYEEQFIESNPDPVDFLIRLWGGFNDQGSMVQPNAWLTPKKLINKAGLWNEDISLDDDGEFFSRVILASSGIIKTPNTINFYRKYNTAQSLSAGRTLKNLKSLLLSIKLKKQSLFSINQSKEASYAINRQFFDLFLMSYPKYPDIYKQVIDEMPKNFKPKYHNVGGKKFNLLVSLLGIRTALYLRHFLITK